MAMERAGRPALPRAIISATMAAVHSSRFLSPGLALATAACAQTTLEVTSGLGTKFSSPADDKGAVAAARTKLAADQKNPDLLLKLAQAQVSVRQDREAVETLTRALAISPQDADLYTERGHREVSLRLFTQARADLTRAADINPKNMAAYYHLGLAHYFLSEFSLAAEAFRHAVATAPNTDEVINSTNRLYAALRRANRPADAVKALEAAPPDMTNKEPHTKFYLNLVRFFQGRMSEADALPPAPPADNTDQEVELPFDTRIEPLQAEIARLQQWVNDLQSRMCVNCAYCGHRYGPDPGTPVAMADVAHIEKCPEHPLSKARAVPDVSNASSASFRSGSRKSVTTKPACDRYASCDPYCEMRKWRRRAVAGWLAALVLGFWRYPPALPGDFRWIWIAVNTC